MFGSAVSLTEKQVGDAIFRDTDRLVYGRERFDHKVDTRWSLSIDARMFSVPALGAGIEKPVTNN